MPRTRHVSGTERRATFSVDASPGRAKVALFKRSASPRPLHGDPGEAYGWFGAFWQGTLDPRGAVRPAMLEAPFESFHRSAHTCLMCLKPWMLRSCLFKTSSIDWAGRQGCNAIRTMANHLWRVVSRSKWKVNNIPGHLGLQTMSHPRNTTFYTVYASHRATW